MSNVLRVTTPTTGYDNMNYPKTDTATKPDAQIAVKPFQIFQKELTLRASYINPHTQHRALELIDSGRLDVESMVCRTIGLAELERVLADPALRAEGKYIVDPAQ